MKTFQEVFHDLMHKYFLQQDPTLNYLRDRNDPEHKASFLLDPDTTLAITEQAREIIESGGNVSPGALATIGETSTVRRSLIKALDLEKIMKEGNELLNKAQRNQLPPKDLPLVRHNHCCFLQLPRLATNTHHSLLCCLLNFVCLQFRQCLSSDFPPPTKDDNENLGSVYCSIRSHGALYSSPARQQFQKAIKEMCPHLPEKRSPHNDETDPDRVVNLRRWTPAALPVVVVNHIQAVLYTVRHNSLQFLRIAINCNHFLPFFAFCCVLLSLSRNTRSE